MKRIDDFLADMERQDEAAVSLHAAAMNDVFICKF
jgi:hypothetical protein